MQGRKKPSPTVADTSELAKGYTLLNSTQYSADLFLLSRLAIPPGSHVLDIGCGPGDLTAHIASLVGPTGSATSIGPSPERIALAQKLTPTQPNLTFHLGIAEDLSRFPSGSFDVVFVNSTLHWVEDQPRAMHEFALVLKAGGRLGISGGPGDYTTAQERIMAEVMSREPYSAYVEGIPPRFLKRREMEGLLDEAGFSQQGREIVVNRIVKVARDGEAMIEWLDASSGGKTYGGILVGSPLRARAMEEMKREWDKVTSEEGIRVEMELLVTVAVKE